MAEDLPAFERPTKATSGRPDAGSCWSWATVVKNWAVDRSATLMQGPACPRAVPTAWMRQTPYCTLACFRIACLAVRTGIRTAAAEQAGRFVGGTQNKPDWRCPTALKALRRKPRRLPALRP